MKHLYYFAHACEAITPRTVFFVVSVGNTRQDREAAVFISSLAKSSDYYWQLRSAESSEFLRNVAASMYPDATLPLMELRIASIDVQALSKCLREGCLQQIEDATPTWAATAFNQRAALDGDFHFKMRSRKPCNS